MRLLVVVEYKGGKMGITIIVTKGYDIDFNETDREIDEEEWGEFVESQDNLRFNSDTRVFVNSVTGETVEIAPLEGEVEVSIDGSWQPFLSYNRGELHMRYHSDMENPQDPVRVVISDIANYFSAVITHDAGDEILQW